MSNILIPHDAIVFVGDGRKALFLRNHGDHKFIDLKTERVFVDHNPPTHEQGTDKPGLSFSSVGYGRSAVEATDWHDLEEHRFARVVADALEKFVRERKVKSLVIVAPPRTLADPCHRDECSRSLVLRRLRAQGSPACPDLTQFRERSSQRTHCSAFHWNSNWGIESTTSLRSPTRTCPCPNSRLAPSSVPRPICHAWNGSQWFHGSPLRDRQYRPADPTKTKCILAF
jgi:protein required for attachment to host cells